MTERIEPGFYWLNLQDTQGVSVERLVEVDCDRPQRLHFVDDCGVRLPPIHHTDRGVRLDSLEASQTLYPASQVFAGED